MDDTQKPALPAVNLDALAIGDWSLLARVGQGKATRAEIADLIVRLMGPAGAAVPWRRWTECLSAIYDALSEDANPKAEATPSRSA
jgi:hypothetical protein